MWVERELVERRIWEWNIHVCSKCLPFETKFNGRTTYYRRKQIVLLSLFLLVSLVLFIWCHLCLFLLWMVRVNCKLILHAVKTLDLMRLVKKERSENQTSMLTIVLNLVDCHEEATSKVLKTYQKKNNDGKTRKM